MSVLIHLFFLLHPFIFILERRAPSTRPRLSLKTQNRYTHCGGHYYDIFSRRANVSTAALRVHGSHGCFARDDEGGGIFKKKNKKGRKEGGGVAGRGGCSPGCSKITHTSHFLFSIISFKPDNSESNLSQHVCVCACVCSVLMFVHCVRVRVCTCV